MKGGRGMKNDYAQHIGNGGAQEVAAMKKPDRSKRGRAVRGKDLRGGK